MKKIINGSWLVLLFTFALLVFVSSCKKKYDYHITGTVVKATTQEPLEGVLVEVYRTVCSGGVFTGGCGPDPDYYYSTTTNANGEFEMVFMSKETQMKKKSARSIYAYSILEIIALLHLARLPSII